MDIKQLEKKKFYLEKEISEDEKKLSNKDIYDNPDKLKKISKDIARARSCLDKVVRLLTILKQIDDTKLIIEKENDEDLVKLAEEEMKTLEKEKKEIEDKLSNRNKNMENSCIIEIRAGTGGEEASLFAYDLFRMYSQYAKSKSWKISIIGKSESGSGGIKEIITQIDGENVYNKLQFENGVHRVQRIPVTESSGRIHTSVASVVVYPLIEEKDVNIDEKDIKVDVYRSSGPGGQSVNTTDSAVRITHLPTGIVVTCQDEKSQHKNKKKALSILASKLADKQEEKQQDKISQIRKSAIQTGDRSAKIRTYNFPQDRITDHRIKKSWHNIKSVLDGDIDHIIDTVNSSR